MDYLDRSSAPLSGEDWDRVDAAAVAAARQTLVGRRMIEVLGPLGPGVYSIPYSIFSGKTAAGLDMGGESEDYIVEPSRRATINLPVLYKDFKILWRDVEADKRLGLPLDVSTAAVAAGYVAVREDNLIFNGSEELGLEGLLTATGRQTVAMTKWEESGAALATVIQAAGKLAAAGHYGPYALAVSPAQYGRMVRVYGNTGTLELDQIKAIAEGGVYHSNVIPDGKAVLVATGAHNLALAVGQDLTTAYLGPVNMNHLFRVMETAVLLIRRPDAVCTIE